MEPKKIEITQKMIELALLCCAKDDPVPEGINPCNNCYLQQLHLVKDGHMSTGETCFKHLTMDVIAYLRKINNFEHSQCMKLLEKYGCLKSESEQNQVYIDAYKDLLAKSMELNRKLIKQKAEI